MSDFREEVAGRLERAADRMYNSGFLDEERRYRAAVAEIRAGLSLEETQALEQQLLAARKPGLLNRLTALAAQGEYDSDGGDDSSTVGPALGEALDEPLVTDLESGASQLLSTAASTGLSDPYSSAQAGWTSATQSVNPYTGVRAGDDGSSAFTGGQSVNPHTGAVTDDNPNSFTGGQNVNPSTGDQNTDPFNAGPTPSLLSSPYLLAANDVATNANIGPEITIPHISFDPPGVQSYQAWVSSQAAATPLTPQLTADQELQLNAAIQEEVEASGPGPVDDGQPVNINDVLAGTDWSSGAPTTQPPAPPAATPQPGSGAVPFDPMADSPFASWLLYGNDTPVLDFLTNDSNLQVAQNVAAGVAFGAATIATGGLLLEAAPGIVASTNTFFATAAAGTQSLSVAATPLAAGAAGILSSNPGLGEELEEDLQSTLPALGNELQGSLGAIEQETEDLEELAAEATDRHHIFPQEFRDQLEELGIDIDQYTIELKRFTEHIPLHQGVNTEEWAGTYNDHWAVFLEQKGITADDAIEFAIEFLNQLGLAGPEYPIVPFR
jgi:hypothetical protein